MEWEEALWRTVRTGSGQVSVFAKENCSRRVHREARGPSLVGGGRRRELNNFGPTAPINLTPFLPESVNPCNTSKAS